MLRKRSIALQGHATSIALEPEFWAVLEALAARRGVTLPSLISAIDVDREGRNLASSLRVLALAAFRSGELSPDGATGSAAAE